MTPSEFVNLIRCSVIDENLSIYKDLFANTESSNANDPYWKQALTLFAKLDDSEKKVMFEIIRQVMTDTVSNLLGIFDGVCTIDGFDGEFSLSVNSSEEQLNGKLQDQFLEMVENENIT